MNILLRKKQKKNCMCKATVSYLKKMRKFLDFFLKNIYLKGKITFVFDNE